MAFAGAALVAAIIGCFFAVLALLRPSVPRTYEIHLTTDSMPRTVSLAEEIRADGGLRGEGLMAGIIALINDTRKSLAGMETARSGSRQSPAPEE